MDLRNKILAADDRKIESVHVAEWGCDVYIQQWTAQQRVEYARIVQGYEKDADGNIKDGSRITAELLSFSLLDKNGKRIFSSEDIDALCNKSWKILDDLADRILKFNGLRDDVEEEVKNS